MICNDSAYGNFRTRTFSEIFYEEGKISVDVFTETMTSLEIPMKLKPENLEILFFLLYARYGISHIAPSDENQFIYKVASTIFMYGPTWEKRLEVQDKIRALEDKEIFKGGEAIYNSANAPGTSIAGLTNEDGKVDFLNGQNTTSYRKSKLEGYSILESLLETDVTKEFIDKFAKLFLKIVEPYDPLWYINKEE